MSTYILRRLLSMIPTFFAVSLVVFLIINIAPGRPGDLAATEGQEEATGSKREAYRIFKAQFNLDKPILYNTRFLISDKDVEDRLSTIIDRDGTFRASKRLAAREWLEDCGKYTVPALVRIAGKTVDPLVRYWAVRVLAENAPRRVRLTYGKKPDKATREWNRAVYREGFRLRNLVFRPGAPLEEQKRVTTAWKQWFDGVKDERFKWSLSECIGIFFLETRFAYYWWNLLHLDFGISHIDKKPVFRRILSKLKYSLTLAVPSLVLAYCIAVPLGVFSAVKRDSTADKSISAVLFMLYSLPTFFVGTLLLALFSSGSDFVHWFPTGGWQSDNFNALTLLGKIKDVAWHLVLPLVCMTYTSLAALSRYARTGLLEVINADYIRTARAKGAPESRVIIKHAVRNGMIPVITLLGTVLPILIGGSVIVEVIFGIPGMGYLTYNAILTRDYNTIMAVQLISAVLVMLGVLAADILYALADPRISYK